MAKPTFSRLKNIVIPKIPLLIILVISSAFTDTSNQLPYIKNLLPKNKKGIARLWTDYEQTFSQDVESFLLYLKDHNAAQALRTWGHIVELTMVSRTKLGYLIPNELYEGTDLAELAKHY